MLDITITNLSNKKETYKLKIINTHLPFLEKESDQGKIIRDKTIQETLKYFNILEKKLEINEYIFLMGDLNYRISFNNDNIKQSNFIELLEKKDIQNFNANNYLLFDQHHNSITNNVILSGYNEGKNNNGPTFFPTCKLIKQCPINEIRKYQINKGNTQRIPSWCDRILYMGNNIKCLLYESFDKGQTCKSDHIPVIGLYEITSLEQKGSNIYYQKYLKYKQKYLELKKIIYI